jgi:hypothetical protein
VAVEATRRRSRRRERRRGRRPTAFAWLAGIVLVALVFVAGFLLGKVQGEGEDPTGTQTLVRTLEPTTLTPPATVTVTVSNP